MFHRFAIVALLAASASVSADVVLLSESFNAGSAVDSDADFAGSPADNTDPNRAFNVQTISSNRLAYAATGGVGNSGRLDAPSGQTPFANHRTGFAGFGTYSTIRLAIDGRVDTTGTSAQGDVSTTIGLKRDVDSFGRTFAASDTGMYWRLKSLAHANVGDVQFELEFFHAGATSGTVVGSFDNDANTSTLPTFDDEQWYRFEAVYSLDGLSQIDATLNICDLGSNGMSTPSLFQSFSVSNIADTNFTTASTLYATIGAKERNDNGIEPIDNLSVIAVPEPTSL